MCVQSKRGKSAGDVLSHQPTNQAAKQPAQQFLPNGTSRLTLGPDARKSVHSYLLWGFSVLLKVSPDFLGFHSRRRKSVRDVLSDRQRGGFSGRQRDLRPGSQGWPESPLLLLLLLFLLISVTTDPLHGHSNQAQHTRVALQHNPSRPNRTTLPQLAWCNSRADYRSRSHCHIRELVSVCHSSHNPTTTFSLSSSSL